MEYFFLRPQLELWESGFFSNWLESYPAPDFCWICSSQNPWQPSFMTKQSRLFFFHRCVWRSTAQRWHPHSGRIETVVAEIHADRRREDKYQAQKKKGWKLPEKCAYKVWGASEQLDLFSHRKVWSKWCKQGRAEQASWGSKQVHRYPGHLCEIYVTAMNLLLLQCRGFLLGHLKDLVVACVKFKSQHCHLCT